jgi:hypothetical protein
MLSVKFDTKKVNKMLNNSVSYSYGFLDGVEVSRVEFNKRLGDFTVKALYKYIDSRAKANPQALHHVYEWNNVGSPNGRLFEFQSVPFKNIIRFNGTFLQSSSIPPNSREPFADKARIMENQIQVVVEPKNSDYLVFDVDGETVFTTKTIYIDHPGGDFVAGSFGRVVDDFFSNYLKMGLIKPFMKDFQTAEQYTDSFKDGVKGGSRATGVRAGKKYMTKTGMIVE